MAETFNVPGPCLVKLDSGSANALELLGYSDNGVQITEQVFHSNIPVDYYGGDEGPPGDVQYFGEIHRVRMILHKWDTAVAAKALAKLRGGTAGVLGTAGSLMLAGSLSFRLLLHSTTLPRNYLAAFVRDQVETNRGTKFARLVLDFECHAVAGTVYNTTTS